jgi:peroxiredoxin (alkyl hydroperoxide reductase subunit C)
MEKTHTTAREKTIGAPSYKFPLIGEAAPSFVANSTQGIIKFPEDYAGKWVVLFSYPGDYCTVCATEALYFSQHISDYEDLNVEVLALSVDSLLTHFAFLNDLKKIEIDDIENIAISVPLMSDQGMLISNQYGILQKDEDVTRTVRAMFIINPEGKIVASSQYPTEVARSGDELLRLLKAIQKNYYEGVYTPMNWQPGDDILLPEPESRQDIAEFKTYTDPDGEIYCPSWFVCYKRDPKNGVIPAKRQPLPQFDSGKVEQKEQIKNDNINPENISGNFYKPPFRPFN